MSFRTFTIALGITAALAGLTTRAQAGGPADLSAQILGEVKSGAGVVQMGATVMLYNRYDQMVRQVMTNDAGKFVFDGLIPDNYSIRVSLASFVPAIRRNIAVLAGSENLLKINLASVLSTIELAPLTAPSATLMSDEWKWVLRASQATRPALRLLPQQQPATTRASTSIFSDTTGMIRVSAGGSDQALGEQQDLGTAFGVSTLINGSSKVRVSGNLGYTPVSGLPSASFRATYSRADDATRGAQVALTGRQIYLPSLLGAQGPPGSGAGPVLRTASMTAVDRLDIADNVHLEYGVSLESIAYQQRLNYMSIFGRATYDSGFGIVKFAYSSATDPEDLIAREGDAAEDLNRDLAVLAKLPRISRRNQGMRVQRNQSYEVGYSIVDGSRTYSASAFMEDVSNAAFLMSGIAPIADLRDNMLPDVNSRGLIFNAGEFRRSGYSVAMTQNLGEHVEMVIAAGSASALTAPPLESGAPTGDDLRGAMRVTPRPWVTAKVTGTLPVTGTHLSASYGWTDFRTLVPTHYSLTTKANEEIGWNVAVRQPLPGFGGMRMEASAELRNLLAQGYLPIAVGTQRGILTNSPRGVRGGLSFIF